MTTRSLPVAATAILLLSLTACVGGHSAESASLHSDPEAWAQKVLGGDLWQAEGFRQAPAVSHRVVTPG